MKLHIISSLIATVLLVGCGGSSDNQNDTKLEALSSNIPYLRTNHANYSEHGSTATPAPTKDANKRSIDWIITASSEEGAKKLSEHIRYMINQLKTDQNPRAFDKLFLMEAYMKFNAFYTTSVERDATTVIISKNASTDCAYKVISAHSNVVSGDFFAKGDINNDHSAEAESILASSDCNDVREDLTLYISQRQSN